MRPCLTKKKYYCWLLAVNNAGHEAQSTTDGVLFKSSQVWKSVDYNINVEYKKV